jgi:hypothetical protein
VAGRAGGGKLGFQSRAQVAAWVVRKNLLVA